MSQTSEISEIRDEEDIFQILLATDIHLGYAEDDAVRGPDTFDTLEEILQTAVAEQVDFVLLGGDLFHHAQPSPYCIYKCMEIFKKYCLGDRPVSIEFLSDPSETFSRSANSTVNYEDPNVNISLPVFSIHGNHDDPTGQKHVSSLDLLSTSGLVNYFGRCNQFNNIEIPPILLKKGKSKLALYGLSHIRDERLGRLFLDNKVKLLTHQNPDDYFNLLVWHQNRASRGNKNFIPEGVLQEVLDLVVWGHEHDCRIVAERTANGVYITQPGSSVATSLIDGESTPKKVGILKIHKKDFLISPIELKTVRPFEYAEITLKDHLDDDDDDIVSPEEYSKQVVIAKIESMIEDAKNMGQTPKVSEKPLIRLIVRYKKEQSVFNAIRFGQSYIERVANPETMVKFLSLKDPIRKKKIKNEQDEEEDEGPILAERVEDLVSKHFTEKESLSLFSLNILNGAVKKFIDSNDANAINDVAENFMLETLKQLEKDLPEIDNMEEYIINFKNGMENDADKFVNKIINDPKRQLKKVVSNKDASESIAEDDGEISDNEADTSHNSLSSLMGNKNTSGRGKGSRGRGATSGQRATRARGPRRGRGRA